MSISLAPPMPGGSGTFSVGAWNIRSARGAGLAAAAKGLRQMGVGCCILTETKLTDDRYPKHTSGYCIIASTATESRNYGGRTPGGRRNLARPDRNRHPFLPDVQCAACKRVGHVATHCDMLATAICLERYMKHDMSATIRDSVEKEWLDCWRDRLGNPTQTPRQVLRAYVEELDITVAGLENAMEWDTWDEPSDDEDGQDE